MLLSHMSWHGSPNFSFCIPPSSQLGCHYLLRAWGKVRGSTDNKRHAILRFPNRHHRDVCSRFKWADAIASTRQAHLPSPISSMHWVPSCGFREPVREKGLLSALLHALARSLFTKFFNVLPVMRGHVRSHQSPQVFFFHHFPAQ